MVVSLHVSVVGEHGLMGDECDVGMALHAFGQFRNRKVNVEVEVLPDLHVNSSTDSAITLYKIHSLCRLTMI